MNPLMRALRRKFKTPHDALRALGIDPDAVLAFDSALGPRDGKPRNVKDALWAAAAGHKIGADWQPEFFRRGTGGMPPEQVSARFGRDDPERKGRQTLSNSTLEDSE